MIENICPELAPIKMSLLVPIGVALGAFVGAETEFGSVDSLIKIAWEIVASQRTQGGRKALFQ